MLKTSFTRMSKYMWHCGTQQNNDPNGSLMLQRCLSTLFHLCGIHTWTEGKFIDIFHQLVGPYAFPEGYISEIWMREHLQCDHINNSEHQVLQRDSRELALLVEDLCSTTRLHQLERAAHLVSTSALESHHSVTLNYRPKRYI